MGLFSKRAGADGAPLRCAPGLEVAEPTRLESAWFVCHDLFAAHVDRAAQRGGEFDRELLFCLLGGFGVTFELALSATDIIGALTPFGTSLSDADLRARLLDELTRAQFEPLTKSGEPRRYRFPERKSEAIVEARRWIVAHGPPMDRLTREPCERKRREILVQCPGIGLKSASWLLRNLGLGSTLAILDVHVLRVLRQIGRISGEVVPRDYAAIERIFLDWCEELGARPDAFDLFLWEWSRGSLGPVDA